MIDWLTDWLTNWLIDWLTAWLTDWQTDWLTHWLTDSLTDWLTHWLTDWLTDSLTDWLTHWLNNQLTGSGYCKVLYTLILKFCYIETSYYKVMLTLRPSYVYPLVKRSNTKIDNSTKYHCGIWDKSAANGLILFFFARCSLNIKYFYLSFFIYSLFTVNLTILLLCLNSWSIDSQRNSTSEFTRVSYFNWSNQLFNGINLVAC